MPRDIFGNYTLPAGNPVVTATIIATSWANNTLNDIATALTNSLSIDGSVTTVKIANLAVTTAKLADNAVTTIKITDANVTRPKLSVSLQNDIMGRNWIINGAFQIWQAGTSLGSGTGKRSIADMVNVNSTGSTYTVAQVAWAIGQTTVDPAAEFYQNTSVTSVANAANFALISHVIENASTLAGKQVVISFWGQCPTAEFPIAVEISQNFGTGGSPSAQVNTFVSQQALTTGFQQYALVTTLPSVAGKTFGSNDDDHLQVNLWLDAGANFNSRTGSLGQRTATWNFWGVKLEEGPEVTGFEIPNVTDEYMRCLRYYNFDPGSINFYNPLMYWGPITSASVYEAMAEYKVKMQRTPTVTLFANTLSGFAAGATVNQTDQLGCRVAYTANVTSVTGAFKVGYIADCRY